MNSVIISADENITPQFSLTQSYTRSGSGNNISGGLRFVSNNLTLGVGQQLYYSPLAGNSKVSNVWTFNVAVRVWSSVRAHAESYVSQNGNLRYTFWMDGFRFSRTPGQDVLPNTGQQYNVRFGKFVVRGSVVDETGQPVWGISVRVDNKMAYSGNSGNFLLYFNEGQNYPVFVQLEQSLATYGYEVLEAPTSVRAETLDSAPPIRIVVRKLKHQPPPTPPIHKRSDSGREDDGTSSGGSSLQSILRPTPMFGPVARDICSVQ
jgi:hypothetical protein